MMLTLLGLAIGAWAIDFREAEAGSGIPLGTGIWSAVSMLIAAFAGGYVAARMGGAVDRTDGVYYGVVVWAVTWLTFAWLTTTVLSFMIGGLFNAFGSAVQSIGQGLGTAASRAAGNMNVNISADDLQRQIESVLQATGKKELQPGEIKQDTERITGQAQSGKPIGEVRESALNEVREKLSALDRDAAVNVLVNKLGMTRPQAEQVVQSTIGVIGPIQQTVQNLKQQSVDTANKAVAQIGSAAWWMFLLALLTLGVSGAGGAFGAIEEPALEMQGEARRDVRRTG